MNNKLNAVIMGSIGGILLSFDALLIKLINTEIIVLVFFRGMLMFFSFALYVFIKKTRKKIFLNKNFFIVSLLYGFSYVFFTYAITKGDVANVLFIIAMTPLVSVFLSLIFLKERISKNSIITIFICSIAVVFIFFQEINLNLYTNTFAFLTSVFMGSAFTLSKFFKLGESAGFAPAVGGGMSALGFIFLVDFQNLPDIGSIYLLILEGAVIVPLSLGLINYSATVLPPERVSFFLLLETVLGPFWTWLFLGHIYNREVIAGGIVIILTLFVSNYISLKKNYISKKINL